MYHLPIFPTLSFKTPHTSSSLLRTPSSVSVVTEQPPQPCNPSPCGANAICKEQNGAGSCTCVADYFGDPYSGCRPECVTNNDCARDRACVNNKCRNPCPGVCGLNAECSVFAHAPTCICVSGYVGDPMTACREPTSKSQPTGVPIPCVSRCSHHLSLSMSLHTSILSLITHTHTHSQKSSIRPSIRAIRRHAARTANAAR